MILILQLNGQIQQHQFQWKAANEKWVAQDAVIKNTISQVNFIDILYVGAESVYRY